MISIRSGFRTLDKFGSYLFLYLSESLLSHIKELDRNGSKTYKTHRSGMAGSEKACEIPDNPVSSCQEHQEVVAIDFAETEPLPEKIVPRNETLGFSDPPAIRLVCRTLWSCWQKASKEIPALFWIK